MGRDVEHFLIELGYYSYNFAFSFKYVEIKASDKTFVSDNTGMKLVSPCHLGTI